ncbi:MAG: YifB family Mg chelatase-like AAA ATPase [Lachnospiraceae bacterium]|nr:YifB family Mg chelatase-like AAA ATPase [Lachnospiraceae bacterium]
MFCYVRSGGVSGIDSFPVNVETDVSSGMPGFDIVGYASGEVKEAKDRVRTALKNSGYDFPIARITVNLAPGDVRKSGTAYDLPIALSILACIGDLDPCCVEDYFIAGELSLSGQVCGVKGVLPMLLSAAARGVRKCIIPLENSNEGAVAENIEVYGVTSLSQAVAFLKKEKELRPVTGRLKEDLAKPFKYENDFSRIRGQKTARRGAEIAAAGLHNMIMIGPPGAGKTLIAKCIPSILPPMSEEECLEISAVYSVRGCLKEKDPLIIRRPFVAAHSTSTDISLVGGGNIPRPGAVSLAHKGVLFLDEIPEFSRKALEALRQPIEDGVVHITRNRDICTFPADFMLVAAANPCPCGNYPDMNRCTCDSTSRKRYLSKISGPFLDRMDICITAENVSANEIQSKETAESSETIRKRVIMAHEMQKDRFRGLPISFNSQMTNKEIDKFCTLSVSELALMRKLAERHNMSARTYFRILKVARTIADLAGQDDIGESAIMEAVRLKITF